jgi:hypothetical protein
MKIYLYILILTSLIGCTNHNKQVNNLPDLKLTHLPKDFALKFLKSKFDYKVRSQTSHTTCKLMEDHILLKVQKIYFGLKKGKDGSKISHYSRDRSLKVREVPVPYDNIYYYYFSRDSTFLDNSANYRSFVLRAIVLYNHEILLKGSCDLVLKQNKNLEQIKTKTASALSSLGVLQIDNFKLKYAKHFSGMPKLVFDLYIQ